jgi:hypothetical protein
MDDYLTLRGELLRVLAHLHAAVDGGDDGRLRARAEEILLQAGRLSRRRLLEAATRRELSDLVGAIERVRAALPFAA